LASGEIEAIDTHVDRRALKQAAAVWRPGKRGILASQSLSFRDRVSAGRNVLDTRGVNLYTPTSSLRPASIRILRLQTHPGTLPFQ
jgi:hypothetical protein